MTVTIHRGDCREVLRELPAESVHCVVTSPPYFGLRDYGVAGQIGLEPTPDAFVAEMVAVFAEVRRVLRKDGTVWLNLGDSYVAAGGGGESRMIELYGRDAEACRGIHSAAGNGQTSGGKGAIGLLRPKQLVGIPWRVAFALQADGWYLRQDIIWSKPNPMPESVRDRCTKAHEYLFLLSKSERYYYDADAIREDGPSYTRSPGHRSDGAAEHIQGRHTNFSTRVVETEGRNKRSVWEVTTQPFPEAHFATFPPALIEPCILAGCPKGGTVLDPFGGAGTTGLVADRHGRNAILIELNPAYADMAERRIKNDAGMFAEVR
jgi:DNA modification methylase